MSKTLSAAQISMIERIGYGRITLSNDLTTEDYNTIESLSNSRLLRRVKTIGKNISVFELSTNGLKLFENRPRADVEIVEEVEEETIAAELPDMSYGGPNGIEELEYVDDADEAAIDLETAVSIDETPVIYHPNQKRITFSVFQHNLLKACKHVKTGLSSKKPILPIFGNMLVIAENNTVTLVTSDSESFVHMSAGALVHNGGRFTVPCKTFCDVIKTLPSKDKRKFDVKIDVEWDEATMTMTMTVPSTKQVIVLKGITADEWPNSMTPAVEVTETVTPANAPEIAVQVFEELAFADALAQGGDVLADKIQEVGLELEARGLSHDEAMMAVVIPVAVHETALAVAKADAAPLPKLSEAQTKMLRRLETPRTIKLGQLDWFNPADKLHRLGLATKQETDKKVYLFTLTEEGTRVLAALPAPTAPVTTEIVPMHAVKSTVNPVIEALLKLDVDSLGPIEALTKLMELKRMARGA